MSRTRTANEQGRFLKAHLPVVHGFTTRHGGVSRPPYGSLNLGLSSGDEQGAVERNRDLLLNQIGFSRSQVTGFHQVHGDRVYRGPPAWFTEQADAAVTNDPSELLVVSAADCLPVLLHDTRTGAVGAAHCGWRGTVAGLAARVVQRMNEEFGTDPRHVNVVLGPAIAGACYQVGEEVVERFVRAAFEGHAEQPWWPDDEPNRFRLDLVRANKQILETAGVPAGAIHSVNLCTHCEPARFYSHRRDAGVTGRHWAFISPRAQA